MTALIGVVVVGLVAANVFLSRELRRLRRRTRRLAILARDEARKVRSIDGATAAAFSRVQSLLTEAVTPPADPAAPQKPTFLN